MEEQSIQAIGEKTYLLPSDAVEVSPLPPMYEEGGAEKKERPGKSGVVAASANLVKTFAGAGTLSLPFAFKQAGILNAIISLMIFAALSRYTMGLLVKCRRYVQAQEQYLKKSDFWKFRKIGKNKTRRKPLHQKQASMPAEQEDEEEEGGASSDSEEVHSDQDQRAALSDHPIINDEVVHQEDYLYDESRVFTFPDLGYEALGYFGSALVHVLLFSCNLGVSTVYLVLFSQIMESMVPQIPARLWMVFIMVLFIPMSWLRKFKYLAPASVIGTVALTGCLVVALVYAIIHQAHEIKAPWKYKDAWFNWSTYPLFFGVASFLFCTHTQVLSVEQSLKKRTLFGLSLNVAYVIVIFNNLTFAVLFFLCYGDKVEGNALDNVPHNGPIPYIIKSLICLELMLTYVLVLMPVSEIVDNKLLGKAKKKSKPLFLLLSSGLRTILVLVTFAVAELFAGDFGLIMAFIGAIAPNACGFILPSLFYLVLMRRKMNAFTFVANCLIIGFGIVTTVSCTTLVILHMTGVYG